MNFRAIQIATALSVPLLATCAPAADAPSLVAPPGVEHPEARPFDAKADAMAAVNAALERGQSRNARTLVVMGANWCHDSRALAGWLETPRFRGLLDEKYELVFVDVGHPQDSKGRNLAVARRFGIDSQESTPMLLVVSTGGKRENSIEDAKSWRNAASRDEQEIYDYLASFPH